MRLLHLLALFLSSFLQPGSAVTEYYVQSNTSADCPTESCLTFNEYVNDTDLYFTSNTSFIFLEGEHYLDSALVVDGKSDISMKASANANVIITLSPNAVIRFQDSQALVMSALMMHYHGSDSYNKSALELVDLQNMELINVTFRKFPAAFNSYAMRAVLVDNSTACFTDCSFFDDSLRMVNALDVDDGGAISINKSTVELLGSVHFTGNSARVGGGAIFVQDSNLMINGTMTFVNNSAIDGGAVNTIRSDVRLLGDAVFKNNYALFIGGAIVAVESNLSTDGSMTFINNRAESAGGAIHLSSSDVQLLSNTAFENNSASSGGAIEAVKSNLSTDGSMTCIKNNAAAAAGGAIYAYLSDVQLLGNTVFENNSASNFGGAIAAGESNLSTDGSMTFTNNSADNGGTIYMYKSDVQLLGNTAFENNSALTGGAIAAMDSNLSTDGSVTFTNNSAESGGVVYSILSDLQILGNTAFVNNFAMLSGGAIHARGGSITFWGTTTFKSNRATSGGGLALVGGARAFFQDTLDVVFSYNIAELGGALYSELSDLQVLGNTVFANNSATLSGGAIHALSGSISLAGNTTFTHNTATRGGGVAIEGNAGFYFLPVPLAVIFIGNAAEIGGAIFVDDSISLCSDSQPACFFDFDTNEPYIPYVSFSLNSASKSGPVIYGGNLENCLVIDFPGYALSGFGFLYQYSTLISTTDISSDPVKVCICENGTIGNCTNESYPVKVKRGELFNISLITVGQLNTPVSAEILVNSDNIGDVRLNPQFPASNGTCTNVGISLLAGEQVSNKTIYLYPDGPCGNMASARIAVEITLEECPPGFDLVRDRCDCEERLRDEENITCDISNGTISRRGNVWIQPIWNDSTYLGLIRHPNCPLGFCKSSQGPIQLDFLIPETSDSLCSENRHGLLCGACRQNYSLSLHDFSCKVCEDKYISLLLFFAITGIALIAVLLVLRITVAAGTINGLILYVNIVSVNRDIFFPPGMINVYPLTVFLAWLNLDFGISTCFYDGLDAYSYAWLQYLFPMYLWLLIAVIILINKLPIKVGGLFGSNPVAVLATVVLMSYTKLLQTSIVALTYTQLDYPDNKTFVWLYDANITYFAGKHIYLAVVAILVIAVLILPYTFLLTFGYRLLACSNRRYCFWFNTLKPFLDPYYAPFNGKTRYWNGFLLVVRGGLYVGFAINALGDPSANLVAISVIFFVLGVIPWLGQRIYEKLYVNILEASFILNVCILSIATYHVQTVNGNQAVVTYLSVGIAFAEFIGIVIFHLYSIIRDKLPCKKKPVEQNDTHAVERRRHRAPALEQQQQLPSDAKFRDSILDAIEMDTY